MTQHEMPYRDYERLQGLHMWRWPQPRDAACVTDEALLTQLVHQIVCPHVDTSKHRAMGYMYGTEYCNQCGAQRRYLY